MSLPAQKNVSWLPHCRHLYPHCHWAMDLTLCLKMVFVWCALPSNQRWGFRNQTNCALNRSNPVEPDSINFNWKNEASQRWSTVYPSWSPHCTKRPKRVKNIINHTLAMVLLFNASQGWPEQEDVEYLLAPTKRLVPNVVWNPNARHQFHGWKCSATIQMYCLEWKRLDELV